MSQALVNLKRLPILQQSDVWYVMISVFISEVGANKVLKVSSRKQNTLDTQAVNTQAVMASAPVPLRRLSPLMSMELCEATRRTALVMYDAEVLRIENSPNEDETKPCFCNAPVLHADERFTCDACAQSQHVRCHGFINESEVPRFFVCYGCMLKYEPEKLGIMKDLSRHRNLLHILWTSGRYPVDDSKLAVRLSMTVFQQGL